MPQTAKEREPDWSSTPTLWNNLGTLTRLVYSTDRGKIIALLREASFSDREIMQRLLSGEGGVTHRKRILLDWADALQMGPSEILREAARYGLIPNDRMPKL